MKLTTVFSMSLIAGVLAMSGPVLADSKEEEAYKRTDVSTKMAMDEFRQTLTKWMTDKSKKHDEVQHTIEEYNKIIVRDFKVMACRDNKQAQAIETYFHQQFHALYAIAPDITHGINMSCSRDHKLVPTLWITKFTTKAEQTAAAAKKK